MSIFFYFCTLLLSVAQLVEQLTLNQWVTGSNPVGETNKDSSEFSELSLFYQKNCNRTQISVIFFVVKRK
jgi:hypothetical protein